MENLENFTKFPEKQSLTASLFVRRRRPASDLSDRTGQDGAACLTNQRGNDHACILQWGLVERRSISVAATATLVQLVQTLKNFK
jgi:hypothetical protein